MRMPKYLIPHLEKKKKKFRDIGALVDLVISKKFPSLLMCGQPGIGKSRLVKDRFNAALKLEGFDYRVMKGHSSALGLYSLLYANRDQTLVLDDADSAFQDPKSINLLKAALESYDVRNISWQSSSAKGMDVPMTFDFTGSVIFISNIDESEMDPAVLSRSFHCNLKLTDDELLAMMYEIIDDIEEDVPLRVKENVLMAIEANKAKLSASGKFNLRTLINGIRIHSAGISNWKSMVLQYA